MVENFPSWPTKYFISKMNRKLEKTCWGIEVRSPIIVNSYKLLFQPSIQTKPIWVVTEVKGTICKVVVTKDDYPIWWMSFKSCWMYFRSCLMGFLLDLALTLITFFFNLVVLDNPLYVGLMLSFKELVRPW